ncbi:hypothetical protein J1605_011581 [Eschrichtius robustus]|uniref:HMG box domain-containing protein n=1 Tax=Eschrichtius robustus TaxID=9764 RepID=A0AB34GIR6_ESCRO|nr:hypothetical protein J1605_011581 [Eschrichtius robustus]
MRPFLAILVPIEFLLPSPNGTGSLLPGSSVIQTRCRDLVSLPTQHIVLPEPGDPKEQGSEEPKAIITQWEGMSPAPPPSGDTRAVMMSSKPRFSHLQGTIIATPQSCQEKRKGGWPKGKKRKPPREPPVPRAPRTGYVIFLNEQRSPLRARHPDLPFTEITKMLAAQWAQLPQEKKQRYVYEAVEDKQRYIRELQAYQSSKAYRAFLRRRAAHKVQALCGTGTLGCEFESEGLDFSAIDRPWDELKFSAVLRKASTRQAISQVKKGLARSSLARLKPICRFKLILCSEKAGSRLLPAHQKPSRSTGG